MTTERILQISQSVIYGVIYAAIKNGWLRTRPINKIAFKEEAQRAIENLIAEFNGVMGKPFREELDKIIVNEYIDLYGLSEDDRKQFRQVTLEDIILTFYKFLLYTQNYGPEGGLTSFCRDYFKKRMPNDLSGKTYPEDEEAHTNLLDHAHFPSVHARVKESAFFQDVLLLNLCASEELAQYILYVELLRKRVPPYRVDPSCN